MLNITFITVYLYERAAVIHWLNPLRLYVQNLSSNPGKRGKNFPRG